MTLRVTLYDTTLRDGAQSEDVSFSSEDKLRIAERLDALGVHYIEGGWPGSNPKDIAFFKAARSLSLKHARLAAFGATRRARHRVSEDPSVKALLAARTSVVTIFGKSWDFHVREALRVPLKQNLEMIEDTVSYIKGRGREVIYDAEHFFDGYRANAEYALDTLRAAERGGADCIVLCDTNGGSLPEEVGRIFREAGRVLRTPLGIHAHNDAELAVANTLAAVRAGAVQVHGTINGYGERCGNANLSSIIPNLKIKMGIPVVTDRQLASLRDCSRFVDEIANLAHNKRLPYVGDAAFAHKGGVHVDAVRKNAATYEHVRPDLVGNRRRILISELSGRANILQKAQDLAIPIAGTRRVEKILDTIKDLEHQGYMFEGAEGSLELMLKKAMGRRKRFFDLIGFRVIVEKRREGEEPLCEATIQVRVRGQVSHTAAVGNGPVNALDNALRKALEKFYPSLKDVRLVDYKVRVLAATEGTCARVRVLIESADAQKSWGTVGVSENIIEASYQALVDSIQYKLMKDGHG
ncbi:MAG: citramalate synthase [Nitrospirae bacterium RBG_16_64_22]|nr:MAG: citramalate synthase [Nitrospirae bacterium RBG_16_64_22]